MRRAARWLGSPRACQRNASDVRSSRIAKAAPLVLLSHSLPIAVRKHRSTPLKSHFIRSAVSFAIRPFERSFAWMARCRRLARDYERLPETLAGLHLVAFVILMLRRAGDLALVHNSL